MDAWAGLGTAVIAALVSLGTTFLIRYLERRKVKWLVLGEAYIPEKTSRDKEIPPAQIRIWCYNVGDGDAYSVVTERQNGEQYKSWQQFEQARVKAGDAIAFTMRIDSIDLETASIDLLWVSSPTGRNKTNRMGRRRLGEFVRISRFPGSGNNPDGWVRRLHSPIDE